MQLLLSKMELMILILLIVHNFFLHFYLSLLFLKKELILHLYKDMHISY